MATTSFPAGVGPAGHDPIVPSAAEVRPAIVAAFFDPETRTFPFVDGSPVPVHPVDQEVAIRVGVPLGSIAACPSVGLAYSRFRRAAPERMQATATDAVRNALAEPVRTGDVEFLGAPLDDGAEGRPLFSTNYRNLRLPQGT